MHTKQTILIVDDIIENIDILLSLLSKYDIIPSLEGKTAINIAQKEDVDLILLDIMMPYMDGYEVCKRLKNNQKTKNIPIIFLTAKNDQEAIKKGFEVGAIDYISKPFDPNELLIRVHNHLELRKYEKSLEEQVKIEIQKNELNQQLMFQNSKQAALGEQLIHIAHQWKQPLSELASINTLMFAKMEDGCVIDNTTYLKYFNRYDDIIRFMSNTVDTFSNFYKHNDVTGEFFISECVKNILKVLDATFDFENIKVSIDAHEENKTYANENEFSQVLFSILNNAKDIFKNRKIGSKNIFIIVRDNFISIQDNGGGINEEILDKIFLQNFSSNFGNGIGLYLSKMIIEKNNGIISASNKDDGAIFTIKVQQ